MLGLATVLIMAGVMFQTILSGSQPETEVAHADEEMQMGTIVVTGEGEVTAEPDLAEVRLGVEATETSADAAQATVSQQIEKVKAALIDQGVGEDTIETARFHVNPYRMGEGDEQQFRAQHVLSFEYSDIEGVGDVLDAASKAGANMIEPVRFSLEDPTELEHKALQQAIEKTKAKADTMAETAGKSKGDVLQLSEQGANIDFPVQFAAEAAMDQAESNSRTVIEAGEVRVVQRVTVVYELN